MPCMCGDYYCQNYGPAQGNFKCAACGWWSADWHHPDNTHDDKKCTEIVKKMDEAEYEDFKSLYVKKSSETEITTNTRG